MHTTSNIVGSANPVCAHRLWLRIVVYLPNLPYMYIPGQCRDGVTVRTIKIRFDGLYQFLFVEGAYNFWGRPPCTHPPPQTKTPFRCPQPDKKDTNLLPSQIGIHVHTHQDLKLKRCRVMGAKLRYGRPCTHDPPGNQNWLAQPYLASISSEFHWISHAGTILEVWNESLLHWLDSPHDLHPSACASDFFTCPQTPPFTQSAQQEWQSTGLELRISMICLNICGSGPEKNWSPP